MLGFATVDVVPDETYTIWLTSRTERTRANHTNAVVFRFDDPEPWRLGSPKQMLGDRLVLLTDGTDPAAAEVEGHLTWDHIAILAAVTKDLQDTITESFERYRNLPGKADLLEPTLPGIPEPADASALRDETAHDRTLRVADALARTWTAWLSTELERTKRSHYVHWEGDAFATAEERREVREFPDKFIEALPNPWLLAPR